MSAIIGSLLCAQIAARASAASMSGTAQRTISQPAAAKASICAVVAATSRVSLLHIDCTEIGASPPTATEPM